MDINFAKDYLVPIIKTWQDDKKREGYIPTVDLLIEDLENFGKKTVLSEIEKHEDSGVIKNTLNRE